MPCEWTDKIFTVNAAGFNMLALEIFRFQYRNNSLYKKFADSLNVLPERVTQLHQIPFLPVSFFKTHKVQTTLFNPEFIFESSGTTQTIAAKHFVKDVEIYKESFTEGFELNYGPAEDWCIIGLLPSYLERNNSSLVYMVDKLISQSGHAKSGFYLNEYDRLFAVLNELESQKQNTLLIGVTFALLDIARRYSIKLQHTIIMETGGMKGRGREMIRQEVHAVLCNAFGVPFIHSEYGMTELLSQAYSKADGLFRCPPWMKILLREEDDPLHVKDITMPENTMPASGAINIIDLANIYSCSFIATDDAGKLYADESFEVTGRLDGSDLRGCSLMVV